MGMFSWYEPFGKVLVALHCTCGTNTRTVEIKKKKAPLRARTHKGADSHEVNSRGFDKREFVGLTDSVNAGLSRLVDELVA